MDHENFTECVPCNVPIASAPAMTSGIDAELSRKLAVLGLPWDTSEMSLRMYFSNFGPLESAEVMRDRYSGKSRGFGFVTFMDVASAQRALATTHVIGGRRCEAKIALPKGDPLPPRTTRIFIARIPPSVDETQFRAYFESFGKLQDCYMPKDHTKSGYRGIGFVTFAAADSVEKVMSTKHWMNGHEIAIDRATPKEEIPVKVMFNLQGHAAAGRRSFEQGSAVSPALYSGLGGVTLAELAAHQRRSFDRGGGVLPSSAAHATSMSHIPAVRGEAVNMRSLSEDHNWDAHSLDMAHCRSSSSIGPEAAHAGLPPSLPPQPLPPAPLGSAAALRSLTKIQAAINDMSAGAAAAAAAAPAGQPQHDANPGLMTTVNAINAAMQQLLLAAKSRQEEEASVAAMAQQHSLEAAMKRLETSIASVRAGPRIFVGKLSRDTSEADVKEYFQHFGFVLDVYLPKAKENKAEHRGFGFVTFETEASLQRVVRYDGAHRIKGATIAIDIAMPKVEDNNVCLEVLPDGMANFKFPANLGLLMPQHM